MTTETLEEYLAGDYVRHRKDITDIDALLEEVGRTLCSSFDPQLAWPYQLDQSGPKHPDKAKGPSISTTAMILLALLRLCGRAKWSRRPNGKMRTFPAPALSDTLVADIDDHCKKALGVLTKRIGGSAAQNPEAGQTKQRRQPFLSKSATWGKNDPLTAAWLMEVSRALWDDTVSTAVATFRETLPLAFAWPAERADTRTNARWKRPKAELLDHVFFDLRFLYLADGLEKLDSTHKTEYRQKLESRLHDQLSFISIPDSRFDPAELAFCLEGMLLIQPDAVDRGLFERVVSVLTEAQKQNAHWRPVKPLMATAQGFVIFPVSVEVANSLLRTCTTLGAERIHENFDGLTLPLFKRYWEWLRARMVRTGFEEQKYVGWHSEHVNIPGLIHMWETSQVIEFMLGYRQLLQDHIARKTLTLSRFSEETPDLPEAARDLILGKKEDLSDPMTRWRAITDLFEPVVHLEQHYQIYDRIGSDFVDGYAANKPENYSMLLYGPPGTGKTTIAENIAAALGYRLITITVSDFLAGGEAEIEARAKNIFQVLREQGEAVILFDEIDNFLLDRNTKLYRKQDTLYQFMTPGMLTKLNDLRRAKKVLFIIATNYGNRIDAAIKRPGRIDRQYLVLPPDKAGRLRIIADLARRKFKKEVEEIKSDGKLAKAALYMGYADIKVAVDRVPAGTTAELRVDTLRDAIDNVSATTSIAAYNGLFKESQPYEEFFCLAALGLEVDDLGWAETARKSLVKDGSLQVNLDDVAAHIPATSRNKIREILS